MNGRKARPRDLIVTLDDATGEIYSAFLIEEEGTASTFRNLKEVFGRHSLPMSLYTDRGAQYFRTAETGGKIDRGRLTQVGRALEQLGVEHMGTLFAPGRKPLRAGVSDASGPPAEGAQTPIPHGALDEILCVQEERQVGNDNCVSYRS